MREEIPNIKEVLDKAQISISLDELLNQIRLEAMKLPYPEREETVCYFDNLMVMFPSECSKEGREMSCAEGIKELDNAIGEAYAGYTAWNGEGYWYNKKLKELSKEPVKVYYSAHNCGSREVHTKFLQKLADIAKKTKQEAIAIGGKNLFIIPTNILCRTIFGEGASECRTFKE